MPDESISKDDFRRLEARVEEIIRDLKTIILLEERQKSQGERLGQLEQRMSADEAITVKVEKNLSSWVNRGIGVWLAAVAVWTLTNSPVFLSLFSKR